MARHDNPVKNSPPENAKRRRGSPPPAAPAPAPATDTEGSSWKLAALFLVPLAALIAWAMTQG
jgi:hypothetical protein